MAGTVHEISLNHTKLVTPDGHLVMLPNKELGGPPTETVKAACRRALEQTENLLEDPAPTVYLTAYKESSIRVHSLLLGYAGELVGRVSGSGGSTCGTPSGSTAWR